MGRELDSAEIEARVIEIVADRLYQGLADAGDLVGNIDIDDKIAKGLSPHQIADEVIYGEDV